MKRFFLIDYENVSDSGLEGFFDLTPADTVYIFYTVKACKIGIDFVDLLRKQAECAELKFIRAATGNQALDFQLSSYLGALITENPDPDCAFHIISKDKGYTCLLSFWASMRPGVRVSILPRIADESRRRPKPQLQPAAPTPEPEAIPPKPEAVLPAEAEPAIPAAAEQAEGPESGEGPETVEEAVPAPMETVESDAPALPETAEAAPAESETAETAPEEAAPETEEAAAPQPQSAEAKPASAGRRSRRAKSASRKPAAEAQETGSASPAPEEKQSGRKALAPADRAVMNTAVQQVLSKAKYDNSIISSAASLVIKMYKDGTNMQELYRGFIKSFGREQGLEVYNLIKPVLM